MNFEVHADGVVFGAEREWRCALGRGGVANPGEKREGDGATPAGTWPLRRLLYRADRLSAPKTELPVAALTPTDGWCDAPGDPAYNRPVTLPYPASAESLWREDGVYDLIVVLGYNDTPVVAGHGSAIFLHVARPDYSPTEGCVALAQADLLALLEHASPWDALCIHAAPSRRA
jgi:L,D-peptidoglycan transpeptidase YkuD (ErfK/YbiS/YcfS/YnhG family)